MTRALPVFRWSDAPPDAVIMDIESASAIAYSESTDRLYVLDPMAETEAASDIGPDFFRTFSPSPEDHAMSQKHGILFFLAVIASATGCGVFLALEVSDAIGRYYQ